MKPKRLWDKGGPDPDAAIEEFTVGDDYYFDGWIVVDDCHGSIAHAAGLTRAGLLTPSEFDRLRAALLKICDLSRAWDFPIERSQEDCHTAIEHRLTVELGELGGKIHAGRSRNDQVLTALRIHSRRRLLDALRGLHDLSEELLKKAEAHAGMPMPGYSHTRRAMPTSVGIFLAAFAESLIDDSRILRGAYELNDQSPLGSAAGFGSALPIDREYTAGLLGFRRIQINSLYCQNSRGKMEAAALNALLAAQDTLARMSGDLIQFSSEQYGFLVLPEEMTTGSSIMPQKRNPDVLELVRGRAGVVHGAAAETRSIAAKLPSGYNRDYQLLKPPLIRAFSTVCESLSIMRRVVAGIEFDEKALTRACTREIYAADAALEKSKQGIPFREAYRSAMRELEDSEVDDAFVKDRIKAYKTLGSMGNPGFDRHRSDLGGLKSWLLAERARVDATIAGLATCSP